MCVLSVSQALSHRAHLLPTIVRSLSQATYTQATSMSLKNKLNSLGVACVEDPCESPARENIVASQNGQHRSASIARQLWVHLQMIILNKSMVPLQSFIATGTGTSTQEVCLNHDDLFSNIEQQGRLRVTNAPLSCPSKLRLCREFQEAEDDLMLHDESPATSPDFAKTLQDDQRDYTVGATVHRSPSSPETIATPLNSLDNSQHNIDRPMLPAKNSPHCPTMFAEAYHSHNDALLFEECGERRVDLVENSISSQFVAD